MLPSGAFVLVVIATVILHCNGAPTNCTITLQQYTTIQIGWTQQQVTQFLGSPGIIVLEVGTAGSPYQMIAVQYSGQQSSGATASFLFMGGSLYTKSQAGIDAGVYTITSQQYKTIQPGWTRDQVTSLCGSPGSAISESGTGNTASVSVMYTVSGTPYAFASFTFTSGQITSMFEVGLDPPVSNKITLLQYQTVQIGWTQQQVAQLLGGPGTILLEVGTSGSPYQMISVQYSGQQSSEATASFLFMGGSLYTKSQAGIDAGVYTITSQQYTMIQAGWTRDQVTNLCGSPGSAISESGTGNTASVSVMYTVSGTPYAFVSFTFTGGQITSMFEVGLSPPVNDKITLLQYQTVQIGWTQQQVAQLLGGPGIIALESGTAGSPYQMIAVQYSGQQSSGATASFLFMGGSLYTKSQAGIDAGVYTITSQQYKTIQPGWTRDQVTNLCGSPGSAISESGTGNTASVSVMYTVSGTPYAFVSFTFTGGQITSMFEVGLK